MKIEKDNLHQAIAALRKCANENRNRPTSTGYVNVSALCDDVADYLENQTVEIPCHQKQTLADSIKRNKKNKETTAP